jgi:hypothetical protein
MSYSASTRNRPLSASDAVSSLDPKPRRRARPATHPDASAHGPAAGGPPARADGVFGSLMRELAETRSGRAILTASGATLCVAAIALALLNAAQAPRHPYALAAQPLPTPVFHLRTDVGVTPLPIPTPVLATYRTLAVHLPVKADQITIIAFHQAGSQPVPLHMKSLVAITKSSALHRPRPAAVDTGPDEGAEIAAAEEQSEPEIYSGPVLRLWRTGRVGEPDTAADCGTKPGTPVLAPVTGTVAAVHLYKLYGQYDDYEIHIVPTGWNRVDCVVLHVTDPTVSVGAQVIGGVTRLASVRRLSQWFASQLDEYTHDGGNHVHVQLDALPRPGVVQLMGGLQAEFGTLKVSPPATPR